MADELKNQNQKPTLVAGYYREWTRNGDNSKKSKIETMEKFAEQIERACEKSFHLVILGDANLCSNKWNEDEFVNKNVATILKNVLEQEGLVNIYIWTECHSAYATTKL